jgi:transmembrane sensor
LGAARVPPSAAALLARQRPSVEPQPTMGRQWSAWLVPVAAAAGLAAGFIVPRPSSSHTSVLGVADISTGVAEMTTVELGDGSVVRLAPASRLRVAQSDSTREVTLDGKAFFVVAKMPDRPFVVHTQAGNARVLGTKFELATKANDLRLMVVEGRVALTSGTERIEVRGGEQSGVRDQQTLKPTPIADAGQIEQWVGKFLVFRSTPLRDAAREIERAYGTRVVVTDSVLAQQTVTITLTDEPLTQLVSDVCQIVNARCETRRNEVVMSRR